MQFRIELSVTLTISMALHVSSASHSIQMCVFLSSADSRSIHLKQNYMTADVSLCSVFSFFFVLLLRVRK